MKKTARCTSPRRWSPSSTRDLPENAQVTFILTGTAAGHQPLRRPAAVPALRRLRRAPSAVQHQRAGDAGRPARIHRQPDCRRDRARGRGHRRGLGRSVQPQQLRRKRQAVAARLPQAAGAHRPERRTDRQGARILASLSRLLAFVQQSTVALSPEVRTRLRTLSQGRGGR